VNTFVAVAEQIWPRIAVTRCLAVTSHDRSCSLSDVAGSVYEMCGRRHFRRHRLL